MSIIQFGPQLQQSNALLAQLAAQAQQQRSAGTQNLAQMIAAASDRMNARRMQASMVAAELRDRANQTVAEQINRGLLGFGQGVGGGLLERGRREFEAGQNAASRALEQSRIDEQRRQFDAQMGQLSAAQQAQLELSRLLHSTPSGDTTANIAQRQAEYASVPAATSAEIASGERIADKRITAAAAEGEKGRAHETQQAALTRWFQGLMKSADIGARLFEFGADLRYREGQAEREKTFQDASLRIQQERLKLEQTDPERLYKQAAMEAEVKPKTPEGRQLMTLLDDMIGVIDPDTHTVVGGAYGDMAMANQRKATANALLLLQKAKKAYDAGAIDEPLFNAIENRIYMRTVGAVHRGLLTGPAPTLLSPAPAQRRDFSNPNMYPHSNP